MVAPIRTADVEHDTPLERNRQEPDPGQIRDALAAVMRSTAFRASKQSQHLLQYLVDQTLEGHAEALKERVVGASVFGRDADYDTGTDPIVRVRAADLRKRLAQYYNGEGSGTAIRIEIHPGSYHPIFVSDSPRPSADQATEETAAWNARQMPHPLPVENTSPPIPVSLASESHKVVSKAKSTFNQSRRMLIERSVFLAIIVTLLAGSVMMWTQIQSMNRSSQPGKYQPSLAAFWSVFLNPQKNTDIVLSDSSFSLAEDIGKQTFTLNDYLHHDYLRELSEQNPAMMAIMNMIVDRNLGATGEFKLTQRILALDKLSSKLHVYNAREYTPDLIKQDNVILVGSRISNPWDELFQDRMNFDFTFHEGKGIVNRAPAAGEKKNYTWTGSDGYCLLAYLPNPEYNGTALIIEGTSSETTQAAGDFLLSENQLSNFQKRLHLSKLPYFEVLLKVSWVNGAPITSAIEAYRVYPNLH